MAFTVAKYILGFSNEYEIYWKGDYGAKGEKRAPRTKKTKEQIKKINQINRENYIRRTIKLNFNSNDHWICNKYPAGTKISITEMERDRTDFLKEMRKEYKKAGGNLKFISRMEIGARGGLHFHMIVNRIWSADTDTIINKCWSKIVKRSFKRRGEMIQKTDGLCDYKCLYDTGGYKDLAEYICKQPSEDSKEYEQLSLFPEEEKKKLIKISSSRNLIRPKPEKTEYSHLTVKKLITEGPKATEGYYIDQDSIISGINPFTGLSYLKYTEIKLDQTEDSPPDRRGIP